MGRTRRTGGTGRTGPTGPLGSLGSLGSLARSVKPWAAPDLPKARIREEALPPQLARALAEIGLR